MTDSTGKGCEPEGGVKLELLNSDTIVHKKGFLPLLDDVSRPRQKKSVSRDEPIASPAPSTVDENRFDLCPGGHAKGCAFIPLLPILSTDYRNQEVFNHGPNAGCLSPESLSAAGQDTERPSHEHVTEAAVQTNDVHLTRSKPFRRYEWPLIVNGVYQGEGPLPSCRIEDDEPPTEPKPYAWPVIVAHRAGSVQDREQQPGRNGKGANASPTDGEAKIERVRTDDKSVDESRTTVGIFAER